MLTVVCVLKLGGDFDKGYVLRLMKGVGQHLSSPYRFVCLTDDMEIDFCEVTPLVHDWPGWWSKIELFRLGLEHSIYFDLDTLILGNIEELVHITQEVSFAGLRGFNSHYIKNGKVNFASGVMAGNFSAYSRVYKQFLLNPEENMKISREGWNHGDQGFIASVIGLDTPRLQDFLPDNYIVGKKLTDGGRNIPPKARVLAWSGKPRLHQIDDRVVRDIWRGVTV